MSDMTKTNLNTILLSCTLGLLSFIGWNVHQSRADIAAMRAETAAHSKDIQRQETDLAMIRAKVAAIEIELAKLQLLTTRNS